MHSGMDDQHALARCRQLQIYIDGYAAPRPQEAIDLLAGDLGPFEDCPPGPSDHGKHLLCGLPLVTSQNIVRPLSDSSNIFLSNMAAWTRE